MITIISTLITNLVYILFQMKMATTVMVVSSNSESDPEDISDESQWNARADSEPSTSNQGRQRGGKKIITSNLSAVLDRTKLSDRKATMVILETAKSLCHNITKLSFNRQTIQRSRKKHRETMFHLLKENFQAECPLIVHWDGKMLPNITGKEYSDRLPILVSGSGISQLLTVAKLPSSTGEAQSTAVCNALGEWGIEE